MLQSSTRQNVKPNCYYQDNRTTDKQLNRSAVRSVRTLTLLGGPKNTISAWGHNGARKSNMSKSCVLNVPKPVNTSSLRKENGCDEILALPRNNNVGNKKKVTWGSALSKSKPASKQRHNSTNQHDTKGSKEVTTVSSILAELQAVECKDVKVEETLPRSSSFDGKVSNSKQVEPDNATTYAEACHLDQKKNTSEYIAPFEYSEESGLCTINQKLSMKEDNSSQDVLQGHPSIQNCPVSWIEEKSPDIDSNKYTSNFDVMNILSYNECELFLNWRSGNCADWRYDTSNHYLLGPGVWSHKKSFHNAKSLRTTKSKLLPRT
mmetsp:Transcript_14266/g.18657  ORF Transcript_14266/g.18657 Transcript_14266/m.18657 type:complete len:320 (+) Transcript_14266:614-1573(+)